MFLYFLNPKNVTVRIITANDPRTVAILRGKFYVYFQWLVITPVNTTRPIYLHRLFCLFLKQ